MRERLCQKQHYDYTIWCAKLEIRDVVLLRQKAFYKVKYQGANNWAKTRTVHHNMLFPLLMNGECKIKSQECVVDNGIGGNGSVVDEEYWSAEEDW